MGEMSLKKRSFAERTLVGMPPLYTSPPEMPASSGGRGSR